MRDGIIIIISIFALLSSFIIYDRYANSKMLLSEEGTYILDILAKLTYIILIITFPLIILGMYRILRERSIIANNIFNIIKERDYSRIFIISFIIYGLFYSLITGLLVYKSDISFSKAYNVEIPSFRIIYCCNSLGYMPIFVGYLSEHLGILISPINLLLLLIITILVSINITISIFIYRNNKKPSMISSLGVAMGLFTGCPTCAGMLFQILFGLTSTISMAILAPLQSIFIAISIPVLVLTPLFMLRRYNSCNVK